MRLLLSSVVVLTAACTTGPVMSASADPSIAAGQKAFAMGPEKAKVVAACSNCHAPTIITSKKFTADQWGEKVEQMIARGAKVSDADFDAVVDYLARNYKP
ncbi:MAG: hypothetical protein ACKOUT_11845 [Novosphingobium sp.]